MKKELLNRIKIIQGDITNLEVDAIVNAANNSLLGGGGVDGAIHRAAGLQLLEKCRSLGGCETGDAKVTKGYNLSAGHVIHTVGPIYKDGPEDGKLLSSCYLKSLELAAANGFKTIAFPAISCGVYGYPIEKACIIAIDTVVSYFKNNPDIEQVVFVLFSAANYIAYQDYLKSI